MTEPVDGTRGDCVYCMKPGHVYRHSGGYNWAMCDACRDSSATPADAEAGRREALTDDTLHAAYKAYVNAFCGALVQGASDALADVAAVQAMRAALSGGQAGTTAEEK